MSMSISINAGQQPQLANKMTAHQQAKPQSQPQQEEQQSDEKPQKPEQKAPNCSTPKFVEISSESTKIRWQLITPGGPGSPKKAMESSKSTTASTNGHERAKSAMIFDLQRVDRQQPQIVYSGSETEFELKALKPVDHLQLRVRAVLLDTEGKRYEGNWSPSSCTYAIAYRNKKGKIAAVAKEKKKKALGRSQNRRMNEGRMKRQKPDAGSCLPTNSSVPHLEISPNHSNASNMPMASTNNSMPVPNTYTAQMAVNGDMAAAGSIVQVKQEPMSVFVHIKQEPMAHFHANANLATAPLLDEIKPELSEMDVEAAALQAQQASKSKPKAPEKKLRKRRKPQPKAQARPKKKRTLTEILKNCAVLPEYRRKD